MEVPCYQEISVKNLYEDALKDELLVKYLPTKEQLSGRLPERGFFFGLLCTLRYGYMKEISADAYNARFLISDGASNDKGIVISEAWMAELYKHPYHSSMHSMLTLTGKLGTGIFLMKESSKLYRPHKEREQRKLAKRLGGPGAGSSDARNAGGAQSNRQNLGGG